MNGHGRKPAYSQLHPLGTYPEVIAAPDIPYHLITARHICHDLVYNPEMTEFMRRCAGQGATVKNGLEMLRNQALLSWEIGCADDDPRGRNCRGDPAVIGGSCLVDGCCLIVTGCILLIGLSYMSRNRLPVSGSTRFTMYGWLSGLQGSAFCVVHFLAPLQYTMMIFPHSVLPREA